VSQVLERSLKPSEHPEFFERPPPEGRSRESSIVLTKDGRFLHEGAAIEHGGMARAFSSWIGRHPQDGRYILNNGYDWTYFTVEDTPYFVEQLVPAGKADTEPVLVLSDGSSEALRLSNLRVDKQGLVYCWVKNGDHEARFTRLAQLSLATFVLEQPGADADLNPMLELGGQRVALKPRGVPE